MKIIEKMSAKARDNFNAEGVTIAFLGDSVTQGCFELYKKQDGGIDTIFDKMGSYEMGVFDIFSTLFPTVPVNIINAGISGDSAPRGLARVGRDVLRHEPDLVVVCYGLNDCGNSEDSIPKYVTALKGIFEQIIESGSELIFMTPNMMNTKISHFLTEPSFIEIAKTTAQKQNDGVFDAHIDAARKLCVEMNVTVCDCYALWKTLYESGVDTTELLSNQINHPTRKMNKMFSYELVKTMFMN